MLNPWTEWISCEMFANKVPQENYQTLSTVQGLVIKLPLFTELFQDSFGEVVASHAVMSLSGSPPTGKKSEDKNFILKQTGPGTLFIEKAEQSTNSSKFHLACPDRSGWMANMCSLERWKAWTIRKLTEYRNGKPKKKVTMGSHNSSHLWASKPLGHTF